MVYKGLTKWTLSGTNTVRDEVVTWVCEIFDEAAAKGVEASLWKGFPTEVAWFEPAGRQACA